MVENRILLVLTALNLIAVAVVMAAVVAIYLAVRDRSGQAPEHGMFRGLYPLVIFPNEMIGKQYVWFTLDGDAALVWKGTDPQPSKNKLEQAVVRRGDRLILYDKWRVPETGSVFIPILGGNALKCLSCEDRLWPKYWERVD